MGFSGGAKKNTYTYIGVITPCLSGSTWEDFVLTFESDFLGVPIPFVEYLDVHGSSN